MSVADRSARRLIATCLGFCALWLPACADDAPPSAERLAWTAVDTVALPESHLENQVVQTFDVPAERSAWTLTGGRASLEPHATSPPNELLQLTSEPPGTALRLLRAGSFDLASFDRVRLRLACSGDTLASVAFLRRGHIVAATEAVPITHLATLGTVELTLPRITAERGVATAVALTFGSTPRSVSLASVELLATPPALLVPPADGKEPLALLGDQARRGVGVSSGRPVEATFDVPPDGVLGFGLGVPPQGRWTGDDPQLVVTLTTADTEAPEVLRVTEHLLRRGEDDPVWSDVMLPLATLEGQRVTARFEVRAPAGQAAACVVSEAACWSRRLEPRPPLVLVTTDTHRGDHLGGARRGVTVDTPVLDALAARGVFFEDCFVSVNYTNPSHMALMTGHHPRDVGILDNKQTLAQSAETLAEQLRAAGYRTYAALSAHHLGDTVSGLGQGFDRMTWPQLPQRPSEDTLDVVETWLDAPAATDTDTAPDSRPLFLWLHVFDAHRPYDPPDELLARYYEGPDDPYDTALPELPPGTQLPTEMQGLRVLDHPRAQYKALVSYLDGQLARVLEHPSLTDAVVAVVGDHGEQMGDHEVWFEHAELYTDTLHVPLILAWPEAPAGSRHQGPVSHLDLGRTLLDLVGETAAPFPGRSLLDTARQASSAARPAGHGSDDGARYALSSHGSSASLTRDGLHLILHLRQGHQRYEHHQVELFELTSDPACLHDLVDERPKEAAALRAQLIRWLAEPPAGSLAGQAITDPQVLADLAQLGYTGGAQSPGDALWVPDGCAWCRRME